MTDLSGGRPPVGKPLDAPLDLDRLGAAPQQTPGLLVEVLPETPSTNAVVAERARAGAPEGLVVVTEHQTAGRGRLDRTWETPARSALTFSLLLRPEVAPAQWPWLPLLTGYAVARTLTGAGYPAAVKWPNDVLLGERKVAGILVERIESASGPAAVVGIGLNVGLTEADLPVPAATSLRVEAERLGRDVPDRTDLLLALVSTLREAYDTWQAGGDSAAARLQESYARACVTVGQQVRVSLPDDTTLEGDALRVDEHGRLLVRSSDGAQVAVGAGDVVHVRPR